jgi:hypothetical protein
MDLDAAMNCPASGAVWGDAMRIVARAHMNVDPCAPVLFRVNKSFEYFWRLAANTTALDAAILRRRKARPAYVRQLLRVHERREELKIAAVLRYWAVERPS